MSDMTFFQEMLQRSIVPIEFEVERLSDVVFEREERKWRYQIGIINPNYDDAYHAVFQFTSEGALFSAVS